MSNHFQQIYASKAAEYDRMVEAEDYQGNLLPTLSEICPLDDLDVVEFGAGTGRLTRLLAPVVRQVCAFDISPHMLSIGRDTLPEAKNWHVVAGDNRQMPVRGAVADLVIAGWSFGHLTDWAGERWREEIGAALDEMRRILRPGGTAIILETLGTGSETPQPPNVALAAYYDWLVAQGWSQRWIRTDYQFESVDEADELTRFFFGDGLADRIRRENLLILPECTGIWWIQF